jgi:hypothetical protein
LSLIAPSVAVSPDIGELIAQKFDLAHQQGGVRHGF